MIAVPAHAAADVQQNPSTHISSEVSLSEMFSVGWKWPVSRQSSLLFFTA